MNNLLLLAVTSEYVDLLIDYKKYIPSNYNVTIFTTDVKKVKKHIPTASVLEYPHDVFYYFDKFKYTIDLSNKLKQSIIYVDVGRLCETNEFIWNNDFSDIQNICFSATWGEANVADKVYDMESSLFEKNYWVDVLDYMKTKVDLSKVPVFLERILIVPYKKSMIKVLEELENIRYLFENLSRTKYNVYSGIGNGEGLGMGYVITKLNEPFDFIEKYINKKII